MNNNNKTILGGIVVLVIVLIGGAVLLSSKSKSTPDQSSTQTQTNTQTTTSQTPETTVKEVVVSVTKTGFAPQTVTVKPGTRITWINKAGEDVTVNSDDHPTHQLYRELNLGAFPNDSSVQVSLTKPGKYTYHDHLHPDRTGTIVVE